MRRIEAAATRANASATTPGEVRADVASVGKLAPGAGAGALAGAIQTRSVTALLSPGVGGRPLAAYAAAAVAVGALTIARRDVSGRVPATQRNNGGSGIRTHETSSANV
jgi:hypothetical protein